MFYQDKNLTVEEKTLHRTLSSSDN